MLCGSHHWRPCPPFILIYVAFEMSARSSPVENARLPQSAAFGMSLAESNTFMRWSEKCILFRWHDTQLYIFTGVSTGPEHYWNIIVKISLSLEGVKEASCCHCKHCDLVPWEGKTYTRLQRPVIPGVGRVSKKKKKPYLRECSSIDYWLCFQHRHKSEDCSTLTMWSTDAAVMSALKMIVFYCTAFFTVTMPRPPPEKKAAAAALTEESKKQRRIKAPRSLPPPWE